MKKSFISGILFFSMFSCAAPFLELSSGNLVDFGKFGSNELKQAVFKIKNSGDELLKITKVRKTCGCFKVLPFPKELKAGESGEIKIEIDPATLSGNFSKLVFVQSNDPKASSKILRVTGKVVALCKVTPNNGSKLINIDFEKDKGTKTFIFELSPTDSKKQISFGKSLYTEQKGVSVEFLRPTKQATNFRVKVTIDSSVKRGRFRFPVSLPVKSPAGRKPINLLLYGRIR